MNAFLRTPAETDAVRTAPSGEARLGFRPVALPALAAAVHVNVTAARAARAKLGVRHASRLVHEDEPAL